MGIEKSLLILTLLCKIIINIFKCDQITSKAKLNKTIEIV